MIDWKEALERAAKRLPPTYEGSFGTDGTLAWEDMTETAQYAARACVLEALDALEKAGYVVVPREATEGMLSAPSELFMVADAHNARVNWPSIYTAMIQAWEKERESENSGSHES